MKSSSNIRELRISVPNPVKGHHYYSNPTPIAKNTPKNSKTLQEYLSCLPYPFWICIFILFFIGLLLGLIYLILFLAFDS